jgi:osmotically-inducible protein OsmY
MEIPKNTRVANSNIHFTNEDTKIWHLHIQSSLIFPPIPKPKQWFQKNVAANVVRHLLGVKGVSNRLSLAQPIRKSIEPTVKPVEVERAIKSAFKRSAVVDANKIRVETAGSNVELFGNVRNLAKREEAERAAWAAPGVFSVDNQLTVKWFEFSQ